MHFLVFLCLLIFYLPVAANAEYFYYVCDSFEGTSTGNYTNNSTYQSNLNLLFSALRSNSTGNGFAAGTVGAVPDKVTGIALCRGDLDTSTCSTCLSRTLDILNLCPYYKTAWMWYNSCNMYFSSQYFLSSLANSPNQNLYNINNVTVDPARFDGAVLQLMSEMKSWAVNNSTKLFATGVATNFSTEYPIIYGLVQCTPDMTKSQCQDCLQHLIDDFPKFVSGRIGARTIGIHCNIRYESGPFYEGPHMVRIDGTLSSQVLPPVINKSSKTKSNVKAVAITIPVVAAVLLLAIFCFSVYKKRSHRRKTFLSELVNSELNKENIESFLFGLSTLKAATVNFDESNKLGEGGFGAVYKGTLPNGEEVAVKRLSQSSAQGLEELKNELVIVAKLKHKNLVRVVGVCLEGQEKLLVYEFLPNRSLDTFLFDNERRQELDWIKRLAIINGIARGLLYLHEESQLNIIHRDLKASNILLDSHMNPKISDFGLARLFLVDQTVHVTRRVVGTFGYMAPEYALHGRYSIKSDVFSFGVLLLEIITGKRCCGTFDTELSEDLLSSTWEQWTAGTITNIIDTFMNCPTNEIIRYIHIGLLCVQEDLMDRPRMSEVVIMLVSNTVSLQEEKIIY
ncbi:putative receptor-like protein kinase [Carex littledalei]|uniref:Putative receptor-like protein kinase n=1 Tax=Carex littledalei TaxID=544730 RepID=A0A833Q7Z6_9POAL|nr:putative receptor-like protein kinase [Carex littledalei]